MELLHDLRHKEKILLRGWCVGDDVIRLVAVGDDVLTLLHFHWNDRRHRLDAPDIDLVQLLDEPQNGVQLAGHPLGILGGDSDTGKVRNALYGGDIDGHWRLRNEKTALYRRRAASATSAAPQGGEMPLHE